MTKTPDQRLLPITLAQLPRLAWQSAVRSLVLARPAPGPRTLHLCWFSCQSYFSYLYCSLHSVRENTRGLRIRVLIFSDLDQPLSDAQVEAIKALIPDARVIPWPKSMGWGATQIASIWRAYALAAQDAGDDDIVARIDSDVFFFNDRIFRAALRSRADLVGDGHYVDFRYCQGGCYFFRAGAVRKVNALLAAARINVEDIAAYHFAQRLGLSIRFFWFMMFPDELRNAGGLTPLARWKFSCAHFVMKNKVEMLRAYESEVLGNAVPESYRLALGIP